MVRSALCELSTLFIFTKEKSAPTATPFATHFDALIINRVGMNIPPSGLAVLDPEGVDG